MVEPGSEGTVTEVVTEAMTAAALGSGDIRVLSTPSAVALAERAACLAVEGRLGPGATSVGARIELDHLAPTPVGATVTARARLVRVDGPRLGFDVEVADGAGIVARGTHLRVVVGREEFLGRAARRS
jgi:fluoroacetyl-CoA thioesterase